ncbi:hypothetical protein [Streptomyces sp. I05A-00742]|uniref:hypothetical protein n=1 Tax=Streptomyces sp. I05A-00742 TaxID=2732853 RepID=UPI001489FDB1|nr:hypothetical protein [Streptomyces sp. I05A-00742]
MASLSPPSRFRDPQFTKRASLDVILVRCPKCDGMARVAPAPGLPDDPPPPVTRRRRLICAACGLARWSGDVAVFRWGDGQATDPWFRAPLWLQTETRHGWVWARNPEQLEVLRQFVAASLRERPPWYERGRKMTYIGRLPAWIKRGKNRDEVLRAIDRVRASLEE